MASTNSVSPLSVKMTYKEDMRRLKLQLAQEASEEKTYEQFVSAVAGAYSLAAGGLSIQYKDDEDDLVTIASAADLALARELTPNLLRLTVSASKDQQPADKKSKGKEKPEKQEKLLPEGLRKVLKEAPKPQRKAVRQAIKACWPPPPKEAAEAGEGEKKGKKKLLPERIRGALATLPMPALAKIRAHLRFLWFDERPEMPPAAAAPQGAAAAAAPPGAGFRHLPRPFMRMMMNHFAPHHHRGPPPFGGPPHHHHHHHRGPPGCRRRHHHDDAAAPQEEEAAEEGQQQPQGEDTTICPHPMMMAMMRPKLMARFVQHVTLPDESPVQPGAKLTKTWLIRNDSPMPWPAGVPVSAVCVSGGDEWAPLWAPPAPVLGEPLGPGEAASVTVEVTAPALPGAYEAYYRLAAGPNAGLKFGQRLRFSVMVVAEDDAAETEVAKEKTKQEEETAAATTSPAAPSDHHDKKEPEDDGFVTVDKAA